MSSFEEAFIDDNFVFLWTQGWFFTKKAHINLVNEIAKFIHHLQVFLLQNRATYLNVASLRRPILGSSLAAFDDDKALMASKIGTVSCCASKEVGVINLAVERILAI